VPGPKLPHTFNITERDEITNAPKFVGPLISPRCRQIACRRKLSAMARVSGRTLHIFEAGISVPSTLVVSSIARVLRESTTRSVALGCGEGGTAAARVGSRGQVILRSRILRIGRWRRYAKTQRDAASISVRRRLEHVVIKA